MSSRLLVTASLVQRQHGPSRELRLHPRASKSILHLTRFLGDGFVCTLGSVGSDDLNTRFGIVWGTLLLLETLFLAWSPETTSSLVRNYLFVIKEKELNLVLGLSIICTLLPPQAELNCSRGRWRFFFVVVVVVFFFWFLGHWSNFWKCLPWESSCDVCVYLWLIHLVYAA